MLRSSAPHPRQPACRALLPLSWWCLTIGLALGHVPTARGEALQLIVSAPLSRLACIEEARVAQSVLTSAPGSVVAFEQRDSADEVVIVQLLDSAGLRAERWLRASPDDCAALTEATSLVAGTLLAQVPAPAASEVTRTVQADARAPASAPSALRPAPEARLRWGVLGRTGGNVGLLDGWAGTLSAGVLARAARFEASLELVGWGRGKALARKGGEVHARALGGRLAGCAELLRNTSGLGLALCGRLEVGALHARASGFAGRNARKTLPFLLLSPVLNGHWSGRTGWLLGVAGGPTVAVIRNRFSLTSGANTESSTLDQAQDGQALFTSARWGASFDVSLAKIF